MCVSMTRRVDRSSPDADMPYATSRPSRDGWNQSIAAVASRGQDRRIDDHRRLRWGRAVERPNAQHGLVVIAPTVEGEEAPALDAGSARSAGAEELGQAGVQARPRLERVEGLARAGVLLRRPFDRLR